MKRLAIILSIMFSFASGAYAWSDPLLWKELNLDISKKQALKILNENCDHVEVRATEKRSVLDRLRPYALATGCGKYFEKELEKVEVFFSGKIFFSVSAVSLTFPHSKETFNYFVKSFDETGLLDDQHQSHDYDGPCYKANQFINSCTRQFSYSLEDRDITISHVTISNEFIRTRFKHGTKIVFYRAGISRLKDSDYSD